MATKPVKAPKAETKAAAKPAKKAAAPKKAPAGLTKPVQPSKELGAIVGHEALPRTQVIAKVWDHIRAHKLQNPENKQEIIADAKLKVLFGKEKATMFEMNKLLSPHMK